MTESAQVFQGVHDTPTYTDVFFNKPMRLWVAVPLGLGLTGTLVLTVLLLDSGYVRAILVCGLLLTALTTAVGALMPRGRPSLQFRLRSLWRAARPGAASSAGHPLLAAPREVIGNLSFTEHGVCAHYLLAGLRYYLQPTRKRVGVAERHAILARELPSGATIYGLSVPQDQRQLLRAMLHGHRHQPAWVTACQQMAPTLAAETPRTRIFWLTIPVRRPRRPQPGRSAHQDRRLAGRTRQGIRSLPGGLPAVGRRRHHRATRRIRCPTGHRRHGRLVLAPQRLSRRVHQPAAAPPAGTRAPVRRPAAPRRVR